jgi:hypothetical protein
LIDAGKKGMQQMTRRAFFWFLGALGLFRLDMPKRKMQSIDCLKFRSEHISVFERDGMEIVVDSGGGLFANWTVRVYTDEAPNGVVARTFYGGPNARAEAEESARTYVLAYSNGWINFVHPDRVSNETYGQGEGCLPLVKNMRNC